MGDITKDLPEAIKQADEYVFGKKDKTAYNSCIKNIEKGFTKASDAYILIACNIYCVHQNEYFRIDNYKNIAEWALDKFGMKKTTTHNYLRVIEKFGKIEDGKALGLKDEFKPFLCSQLIAMLTFTPELIEGVKPEMSVREIIEYGKRGLITSDDTDGDSDDLVVDSVDSDDSEAENIVEADLMPGPVSFGSVFLAESENLDEFFANREVLEMALNDLKKDKQFNGKKIRFVLQIAYD